MRRARVGNRASAARTARPAMPILLPPPRGLQTRRHAPCGFERQRPCAAPGRPRAGTLRPQDGAAVWARDAGSAPVAGWAWAAEPVGAPGAVPARAGGPAQARALAPDQAMEPAWVSVSAPPPPA